MSGPVAPSADRASAAGRLAGKVILITGAGRNIGCTAAAAFAAEGAAVACNDRDPNVAARCVAAITAGGGIAVAAPADVTDPAQVAAAVAAVNDSLGPIDVLVNNAAVFRRGGVLTMTPEGFRQQLDVIVTGAFIPTQCVAKSMIQRGSTGSIITVLSTAGWQGEAGNIGYSTAKSALINFTRSVAMELAPYGIRANSFTPTVTIPADGDDAAAFLAGIERLRERGKAHFAAGLPWSRLPVPEDYAGALIFLASGEAELMTGSNLTVDGGALAKYWAQPAQRLAGGHPPPGPVPADRPGTAATGIRPAERRIAGTAGLGDGE